MTPLKPLPKESSMISAAGYDAATQTLRVQFKKGGVGDYVGVPPDVADGLVAAESPGRFLLSNLKGVYEYAPMPPDDDPGAPVDA